MTKPTEKEYKEACKKAGCAILPFHLILGKYANLPMCLRVYCELWNRK